MTVSHVIVGALAIVLGLAVGYLIARTRRSREAPPELSATRKILLPFTGLEVSRRALDAAVRLARVDDATLMPAYLAAVPLNLALDAPLPARCGAAMPLLEAIEQRATAQGVRVDARIERGRSYRHALQRILAREQFDRVIVAADANGHGLDPDDLAWLLANARAEVLILRPAPQDTRRVTAREVAGHF